MSETTAQSTTTATAPGPGIDTGDASNPLFGVEQHGFDFIPEKERRMTLKELAYFWVGSNAYLFFLVLGVIAFSLGLNTWQALVAVFVGNLVFAVIAWGSIAGVRAGLPTMTLTRSAFGVLGNRFNGLLSWVTSVAFEAINTVFGVLAVSALLPVLGWHHPGAAGKIIGLVLVFFLSAGIAVLGHATMVYVQRLFAIALTITLVVVFFWTIGGVHWGAGPKVSLSTGDTVALMFLAAGVVASGPLSYLFNCSDWPRYLPGQTGSRKIFWTVFASAGGSALFLGVMGVLLASQADLTNPVAGVQGLVPEWLFVIFAITAIGGAVGNNVITFYASGLVLQSVGLPLRRWRATLIDLTVATALVIYVLFISEDFTTKVNQFVALMVVWIGPFGGVWLTDGLMRHWSYDPLDVHKVNAHERGRYWGWHGINIKGFIALAAGIIAALLTANIPTVFQGPLSKTLSGADLSWLLGLPVAALVYLLIARREVRASLAVPAEHVAEAAVLGEGGTLREEAVR